MAPPRRPGNPDYYVFGVEATPRKKMQALCDAAYVYAFDGDEQSCQRELVAMHAVYNEDQKLIGTETTIRMCGRPGGASLGKSETGRQDGPPHAG